MTPLMTLMALYHILNSSKDEYYTRIEYIFQEENVLHVRKLESL